MSIRYENIKATSNYTYCNKVWEEQRVELARRQKEFEFRKVTDSAAQITFQKLSISKLGVYNCDQIKQLQRPVEVQAFYVNAKGEKIEPLVIYVIDSRINGMMRYDGYMGFSPYKFKFSPTSNNTLIAIDEHGKSYYYSPEKFKSINVTGEKITNTFMLEKLENMNALKI
jgi:hypothetical protein